MQSRWSHCWKPRISFLFLSISRSCEPSRERCINLSQLVFLFPEQGHQTKIVKAQRKKIYADFRGKKSRECDGTKIFSISLPSTSIHSEHAALSCFHALFTWTFSVSTLNPCMTYDDFIFIKRRRSERKGKTRRRKRYTPIECGFLVAALLL